MRRVVVTGLGAVTPCGLDVGTTWDAVVHGKSGIARITHFDPAAFASQIAGECRGFDPERYVERKRVREADRFIHLAIAAADMAIRSAGFEPSEEQKDRTGTFVGVGMCGLSLFEESCRTLEAKGPRRVTPYFVPSVIANLAPGQVSMRWGLRGPCITTTTACASGAHAIGDAVHWIQRGSIDAAVAGGAEAAVTPMGVAGFASLRALSKRNDSPTTASRPFDRDRDGFVIAEGAAVMLLEEREAALARGAPIVAEILGFGATGDAHHLTQPAPEGRGAQRAIRMALDEARLSPADVDYINAHATSTQVGDEHEVRAIRAVFGDHARKLAVSSTKSTTGHLLGAAGALEAIFCALAIARGVVPPTANLDEIDPECLGVDLVRHQAREKRVRAALSNSFGFGGTNATLLFGEHR